MLAATAIPALATNPSFTFHDADANGWNAFLARTPGGSYQQTSLWGLAKLAVGYRAPRFVLNDGNTIVGGAQLLIRSLPLGGSVAYVPLGPVLGSSSPEVAEDLVAHIHSIAEQHKITYLAVQAPRGQEALTAKLQALGFSSSLVDVAPNASVLLDVSQSLDTLLAKMHKTTRYDIRAAQRKGITVRQGSQDDLGICNDCYLRRRTVSSSVPLTKSIYPKFGDYSRSASTSRCLWPNLTISPFRLPW